MRIEKLIDISDIQVEIEIDHDDILAAIIETGDSTSSVLRSINNFATYMNSISDDQIDDMAEQKKETISTFLNTQASRFKKDK
ncbi:MAG: hypothetical protein JKY93_02275 [Gammaproteobacteria bacterium]|nr:hypothetical protein [Gammaproteobacteria bacterium]